MSEAYSIYEAKTHFSKVVKKVKEGREIIIKERGVPVGKIVPLKKKENFEERLERLALRGSLLPGRGGRLPKGIKKSGALRRFLEERD